MIIKKTLCLGGAANPNANRIGWKKRLPQTDALKSYCSLSNTYIFHGRGQQWEKIIFEVTYLRIKGDLLYEF